MRFSRFHAAEIHGRRRKGHRSSQRTGDLEQRIWQHKEGVFGGHTSKYKIDRLVYFERFGNPGDALAREKEVKRWLRRRCR